MRTTKQNKVGFGATKTPYPIQSKTHIFFLFLALFFLTFRPWGDKGGISSLLLFSLAVGINHLLFYQPIKKLNHNLMKTYDELQAYTLSQSKILASNGEEFSHLVKLLSPDNSLRLKIYVQSLPESVANQTIYGKAHWKEQSTASQKRRK
jgi:hypothetical protein